MARKIVWEKTNGTHVTKLMETHALNKKPRARKMWASPLAIPPWLSKESYFELSANTDIEETLEHVACPEIMTLGQWNDLFRRPEFSPETPEQKLAWKLLYINMSDCLKGSTKEKLRWIDEIEQWMLGQKSGQPFDFYWSFDYWCEQLNIDSTYMRHGFGDFLREAKLCATTNKPTAKLKQFLAVVGRGKRARSLDKQRDVVNGSPVLDFSLFTNLANDGIGGRGPQTESGSRRSSGAGTM